MAVVLLEHIHYQHKCVIPNLCHLYLEIGSVRIRTIAYHDQVSQVSSQIDILFRVY